MCPNLNLALPDRLHSHYIQSVFPPKSKENEIYIRVQAAALNPKTICQYDMFLDDDIKKRLSKISQVKSLWLDPE